jgi:hypothetical protein
MTDLLDEQAKRLYGLGELESEVSMSLLPLSTAWMAVSLIRELVDRNSREEISPRVLKIMRFRSIATLCLFGVAAVVALKYPLVGLGLCISCLIFYLKPDPPGAENQISRSAPR